ncbi:MAG TPA: hypothetical protein VE968_03550, partial [Sphingomicrobium sp.]|nr:hypothetical protein [Sphingomicrobium sp.]
RRLPSGKTECWYILEAEPGSVLGLGLIREIASDELRSAVLDGSIEELVHWQSVEAGDFIYVPAGTIHAIGAGISLLEFQQNADVTYRLYDYGRPRELHLDDGMAVATRRPFDPSLMRKVRADEEIPLIERGHFGLVSATSDTFSDRMRWIMPILGQVRSGGELARAGDILLAQPGDRVDYIDAWALTGISL